MSTQNELYWKDLRSWEVRLCYEYGVATVTLCSGRFPVCFVCITWFPPRNVSNFVRQWLTSNPLLESLQETLGASGGKFNFTLSGTAAYTRVESAKIDLVVMSMDESVSVELSNVRTVKRLPISTNCTAKKEDLENWPHLCDIELQQLVVSCWWPGGKRSQVCSYQWSTVLAGMGNQL